MHVNVRVIDVGRVGTIEAVRRRRHRVDCNHRQRISRLRRDVHAQVAIFRQFVAVTFSIAVNVIDSPIAVGIAADAKRRAVGYDVRVNRQHVGSGVGIIALVAAPNVETRRCDPLAIELRVEKILI